MALKPACRYLIFVGEPRDPRCSVRCLPPRRMPKPSEGGAKFGDCLDGYLVDPASSLLLTVSSTISQAKNLHSKPYIYEAPSPTTASFGFLRSRRAGNRAPSNWAVCDGAALFDLLFLISLVSSPGDPCRRCRASPVLGPDCSRRTRLALSALADSPTCSRWSGGQPCH